MKVKLNILLFLNIYFIISINSAFPQKTNCFDNLNEEYLDVINCDKIFDKNFKINNEAIIRYTDNFLYLKYPNLIRIENYSNTCLNIINGKIYKVNGDSTLFAIIPELHNHKTILFFENNIDSLTFNIVGLPQPEFSFTLNTVEIKTNDTIKVEDFKNINLIDMHVKPNKQILDECMLNYYMVTFPISNIDLTLIRKNKSLYEHKFYSINDLKNKIKKINLKKNDVIVLVIFVHGKKISGSHILYRLILT